jgi:hypothetical protein
MAVSDGFSPVRFRCGDGQFDEADRSTPATFKDLVQPSRRFR